MKKSITPLVAVAVLAISLSACATTQRGSDASQLAAYEPYLLPPVKSIRYLQARNWEKITDRHVLMETRPNEQYLLKLDGPCMQFSNGSPSLIVDAHITGMLSVGSDRIGTMDSPMRCLIREIRPLDLAAMKAAKGA